MSLRCSSCKHAIIRGNTIICSIFGEIKPHKCNRYAPSSPIPILTPLSHEPTLKEAIIYD
ncbi:MAG: hypothetical protein QXT53_05795 [Ignisphaera sp.]